MQKNNKENVEMFKLVTRGFTLIELLAVLLILSILVVIAVPQFLNVVNETKVKAKARMVKTMESAARIYESDYKIGKSEPILISTLCQKDYLDCPLIDPVTKTEITGYIFSAVTSTPLKSIEYKHVVGTPNPLLPILISTVGAKDIAVNKYAGNGLYKNGTEYIYRGGITKTNVAGLATNGFASDTDSGSEVSNYIKVPWETYTVGENCTSSTNKCYRIINIKTDGSMKIVRDKIDGTQVFDDMHNTDASIYYSNAGINYGYNDLLQNTPTSGYPEESRPISLMYTKLYGASGYEKSKVSVYRNLLIPFDICLNKVTNYKNINNTTNPTYVSDTCDVTGKPNTTVVAPLRNKLVGLLLSEEYLNVSTEASCTSDSQYQCRNQNYLYNKNTYWSSNGTSANSWGVRNLNSDGRAVTASYSYDSRGFRPVVILKSTVIISGGTGTITDPYVIMG